MHDPQKHDHACAHDKALGDPGLYERDPAKASTLAKERGVLAKSLADIEERWLAASDAYETAVAAATEVA